jgi:two-component system sensor histidine kinase QseC
LPKAEQHVPTVWFSLRRRLFALLLGGVTAAWLVTVVFSYVDAHHEVDELFDAQLAQAAQTLLALASHKPDEHIEEIGEVAHKYQRRLRFQVWNEHGQLLVHSNNAPEMALTAANGFSETTDTEGRWRHFSQWNKARSLQVQVSENHRIRDELIGHITWRLVFPALIGLPLLGLWVWLATQHGLASLGGIAAQIASRQPQQLMPVTPAAAPEEIRPMLDALNALFQRVEDALDAERHFTANAAHELRTPLAALQAQVQVALRARDDDEREHSLTQLQSGLSRATRLIDQMLQLARLDPESTLPKPLAVDLARIAESVCAELGNDIFDKQLDFELTATPNCTIIGQPEWLRILIRNLVENAIRYTPTGGRLQVSIEQQGGLGQLLVSDSGPGIPADQRAAVLRRFHRLNQSEQKGSGLGLSIVARIAELHGARLELGENEDRPGLRVTVVFPE